MIAILDYDMANLRSVQKGFEAVGAHADIVREAEQISKYDKIVLPGVGAFKDAIATYTSPLVGLPAGDLVIKLSITAGTQVNFDNVRLDVFAPEPGNGVGDPVDVSRRGLAEARHAQHDIVIVDTAGRLGIDEEMMRQAADIRDAVSPDETLFVVDAMIGQDAVTTAQAFMEGVGFDGVVLTKLDGDARGGAALSVRHLTGKPIMFASTGEKLEDFDAFHPDRMASRILDMGDILTLIEQAQRTFDEDSAAKMAGKLTSGENFTLDDFLEQMMMVQKMGPIKNLLGMMPGMGQMRDQLNSIDDRDLDRIAAIIRSMTPAERAEPKMINGSRRARIARGSGVEVSAVNNLVTRFFDAQKMMKKMASGMGIPGMPGGRMAKAAKAQKKPKKGRRVSGDPRKAALGKAAAENDAPAAPKPGGLLGNLGGAKLPPGLELPPGFDPTKFNLPGQK